MAAYTAQTLINNALTNLGVLEQGGTPSVSDSTESLTRLNYGIQQWRIQKKFVWSYSIAAYALTANQSKYPIGPTAASPFNVPRPTFIQEASIQIGTGPVVPLEKFTQAQYRTIKDLTATAQTPQIIYNDRASPLSNLYLWPVPLVGSATNLILDTWAQLSDYATLSTSADLPDGYPEAITGMLGVRLLSMFGMTTGPVAEMVSSIALEAEKNIAELNAMALQFSIAPVAADADAQGQ